MTTSEPGASDVFTHGGTDQAALDRVPREQAGRDHHRRVRRVRARRDRGDHDVAVGELERCGRRRASPGSACASTSSGRSPAPDRGLLVRVGVGRGRGRVARGERLDRRLVGARARDADRPRACASRGGTRATPCSNSVLRARQRHAVLRPRRPGERRLDRRRGRARASRRRPGRAAGSCHIPCSLAYASTSATRSSGRPVARR